ncbi:MAG: NAD+ synthase [Desulfomonilaceae bacterium]|nr:NAD+ synthase [Desulfomonilaceae bacterium]
MADLRIAQAQINTTLGDFESNLDKIVHAIGLARAASSDIVTFPELALCGYPPEDLLLRPGFLKDNRLALQRLAPHCEGVNVLVGFADSVGDRVYNAAALFSQGRLIDVYHKVELPNYGVFDEKRYFSQGTGALIFDINGVRCSASVCEDIWIEGSVTEDYARRNGAHVVFNIAASPFHAGKPQMRREIFARFARAANAILFVNNLVGGQDELVFDGGSFVLDEHGELVANAARFEEDLLVTDIRVEDSFTSIPSWNLKGEFHVLEAASSENRAFLSPSRIPEPDPLADVHKALVLGTRDYVLKNGFKKVLLGLSGGIDSALTAAIAVDALGKDNVIGVTMPSRYTSKETLSDAGLLAESLGVRLLTIPIDDIFQGYLTALEEPFREGRPDTESENLQARVRGNILMALSNRFGHLVLTTGNKSEIAVGYCTLYGDTSGGFAVLKDVPKTLVYQLSRYVNACEGRPVIPESTILRAPSAELRADQKDEDSLPPYPVLDAILKEYVEEDKSPEDIVGFDPRLVTEVVRMVDRNEYKRRQMPPGVKITPKAFGKDRRMPITNRYLDFIIRG